MLFVAVEHSHPQEAQGYEQRVTQAREGECWYAFGYRRPQGPTRHPNLACQHHLVGEDGDTPTGTRAQDRPNTGRPEGRRSRSFHPIGVRSAPYLKHLRQGPGTVTYRSREILGGFVRNSLGSKVVRGSVGIAAAVSWTLFATALPVGAQDEKSPDAATVNERPGIEAGREDGAMLPLMRGSDGSEQVPVPEKVIEQAPTGDFMNRPGDPLPGKRSFDQEQSVELVDRRSEVTSVFRNPDGTETSQTSLHPIRFRDERGEWQSIDLALEERDGVLAAKSSNLGVAIPVDGSATALVATPSGTLVFGSPEGFKAEGTVRAEGLVASVDGVNGLRSETSLHGNGFEHALVVPDRDGTSTMRVSVRVPDGVTVRESATGDVDFFGRDGNLVGSYGGAAAVDAAEGSGVGPAALRLVSADPGIVVLEVMVDRGWWDDPARAFPVRIDPSWSGNTATAGSDTYVSKASPTTSYSNAWHVLAGTNNGGGDQYRGLVKFNLPAASANYGVTAATLDVYQAYSTTCTKRPFDVYALGSAFSSTTTWNTQPVADEYGSGSTWWFNKGFSGSCPAALEGIEVSRIVQRWMDGKSTNHGFLLRSRDEDWDSESYKQFVSAEGNATQSPKLTVTYNTVPRPPDLADAATAPKNGSSVGTVTPTLTVPTVTDPDGNPVSYWFRIWTGGDKVEHGQVIDSGWQTGTGSNSWTVPSSQLQNGVTYFWRVYATDNTGGVASGEISPAGNWLNSFSVDLIGGSMADAAGPVNVNLVTGNATVSVGQFTYNSLDVPPANGLRGYYYTDSNDNQTLPPDDNEAQSRVDPQIQFNWDDTTPLPNVGEAGTSKRMQVQWKGTVRERSEITLP